MGNLIETGTEYRDMSPAQRAEQEALATEFCEALRQLCSSSGALWNFELYLSRHFFAWMAQYAADPYSITDEIKRFSEIE